MRPKPGSRTGRTSATVPRSSAMMLVTGATMRPKNSAIIPAAAARPRRRRNATWRRVSLATSPATYATKLLTCATRLATLVTTPLNATETKQPTSATRSAAARRRRRGETRPPSSATGRASSETRPPRSPRRGRRRESERGLECPRRPGRSCHRSDAARKTAEKGPASALERVAIRETAFGQIAGERERARRSGRARSRDGGAGRGRARASVLRPGAIVKRPELHRGQAA